jgi:biotin carboxyl carrier protein
MSVYQVNINGKMYTVEIPNLHERPVRAIVDGEVVTVDVPTPVRGAGSGFAPMTATATTTSGPVPTGEPGEVRAPLPGTVVEINVAQGDNVTQGQVLCVLEAMKMNNPIQATQAGTVRRIMISLGQQVQHDAPLMLVK